MATKEQMEALETEVNFIHFSLIWSLYVRHWFRCRSRYLAKQACDMALSLWEIGV